jgi:ubiquinone/menaquinone biosynthesis C-methylase UbiE
MRGEEAGHRVEVLAPPGVHEKVLEVALGLPGTVYLDVPTGSGVLANKLLKSGKKVTAGDIDINQFEIGIKNHDLTLVQLDLNEKRLLLQDNFFDVAISVEGIEHLQNQWHFIRNIARVLKPNGFLIITTPNILNIRSRVRYFMEGRYEHFKQPPIYGKTDEHTWNDYHISPLSYFEFQFMLKSCGFSIEKIHTNSLRHKNFWTMLMKPLFKLFYLHKNHRDRKRKRGEYAALYKTITSDEIFYGESLIVVAKKN